MPTVVRTLPTPRASDPANESSHSSEGFRPQLGEVVRELPTPTAADADRTSATYVRGNPTLLGALLPTPNPFHLSNTETPEEWLDRRADVQERTGGRIGPPLPMVILSVEEGAPVVLDGDGPHRTDPGAEKWGVYAAAVHRHEQVFGREAPHPTEPGSKGGAQLSPRFVEWMMGLPDGHVTDPAIWEGMTNAKGKALTGRRLQTAARNAQLHVLGNGVVPAQAAAAIRHLLDTWGDDG